MQTGPHKFKDVFKAAQSVKIAEKAIRKGRRQLNAEGFPILVAQIGGYQGEGYWYLPGQKLPEVGTNRPKRTKRDKAIAFLQRIPDWQSKKRTDLVAAAEAEGITYGTLDNAMEELKSAHKQNQPETRPAFVPSPFQRCILGALEGKAMTGDALQNTLVCDRKRLYYDGLNELKEHRLVINVRRLGGYLRPDAPPKGFSTE